MKFKEWRILCEKARKQKFFEKKVLMVDKIEGTRTEMLIKRCFDAIRYSNVKEKYLKTKAELEDKIPVKLELERQKEELIKVSNTKDKAHLFKNFMKRYQDVQYKTLIIWKEYVKYFKFNMDRIKLRLIGVHKKILATTLYRWKAASDKKELKVLAIQ